MIMMMTMRTTFPSNLTETVTKFSQSKNPMREGVNNLGNFV